MMRSRDVLLGVEYVKAVLRDGRLVGAILIGETDLEVCVCVCVCTRVSLGSTGDV